MAPAFQAAMKTFLLAALAAVAATTPAAAQDTPPPFNPTPTDRYFECTGALPVQTIDVETFSWSAEAPTASYQEGAGCGFLDIGLTQGTNQPNTLYDAAFGGEYRDEVKQIELTLYGADLLSGVLSVPKPINLKVIVNGAEVASFEELTGTRAVGPADQISKFTYTVPDLDIPATTRSREIVLAVQAYYSDDVGGWLFGAAEVPSQVRFFDALDIPPVEEEPEEGA